MPARIGPFAPMAMERKRGSSRTSTIFGFNVGSIISQALSRRPHPDALRGPLIRAAWCASNPPWAYSRRPTRLSLGYLSIHASISAIPTTSVTSRVSWPQAIASFALRSAAALSPEVVLLRRYPDSSTLFPTTTSRHFAPPEPGPPIGPELRGCHALHSRAGRPLQGQVHYTLLGPSIYQRAPDGTAVRSPWGHYRQRLVKYPGGGDLVLGQIVAVDGRGTHLVSGQNIDLLDGSWPLLAEISDDGPHVSAIGDPLECPLPLFHRHHHRVPALCVVQSKVGAWPTSLFLGRIYFANGLNRASEMVTVYPGRSQSP